MRGGCISSCLAGAVIALLSRPAIAAWPVDGAPIVVAPGGQGLQTVVGDGPNAFFVGWVDDSGSYSQVRVQRILANGTVSPGWPAGGVAPAVAPFTFQSRIMAAPDGTGGSFVAWNETWYGPSDGRYYVRLQRLTVAGALAPGWPIEGLVIAEGFFGDISTYVTLEMLAEADGGCVLGFSTFHSGCHDGLCGSGGNSSFARVGADGVRLASGAIEPYCATASRGSFSIAADSDGDIGLYSCSYSPCTGLSSLRHLVLGDEAGITLPVPALPQLLTIVADGSLIARAEVPGGDPRLFHWNPDGTPASGSPEAGAPLPSGLPWAMAVDPSGTCMYSWRPTFWTSELRVVRRDASGAVAPGWDPNGLLLAGPPANPVRFHGASPDGSGGAYLVWTDARNPATDTDIYASHVLPNGSLPPEVPVNGYALCEAPGAQLDPMIVTLGPGVAIAVWHDGRSGTGYDIYAQLLRHDTVVPTQASLARADATAERVRLEWRLSEQVPEAAIERTRDGGAWAELARVTPASLGRVIYEDTDVRPGESLGYRLVFVSEGQLVRTSPAWVSVPMLDLALRIVPTHVRDRLAVEATLASDEPARLELVDVTGRQRLALELRDGAGTRRLELPLEGIEPSVAWLRLRQGREARTLRLAITR